MGLVPILWLGVLAYYGQRRSPLWWALGITLSISWVADTAAHWVDPWLVSALYPIAQTLVMGIVLIPAARLSRFLGAVALTTGLALLFAGTRHPEMLIHTICWTGILVLAWPYGEIRGPTILAFGVGWLAWVVFANAPTFATWGVYQGIRAFGLGVFCWASAPTRVRA
jgi:hypothetical protein